MFRYINSTTVAFIDGTILARANYSQIQIQWLIWNIALKCPPEKDWGVDIRD